MSAVRNSVSEASSRAASRRRMPDWMAGAVISGDFCSPESSEVSVESVELSVRGIGRVSGVPK